MRWSRVRPATSTSVLPSPSTARATSATQLYGQIPIAASGAPQSTIPSPKSEASRLRPISVKAASAPDEAADAHRCVQQTDRRIPSVQEVESRDDY